MIFAKGEIFTLTSLSLIFLIGFLLSSIFAKLKLPSFLGLLLTGVILGSFHLLGPSILSISSELRQIALIIILARAGLSLDIKDLKKVGRPALLMCFVPAVFEMIGVILIAPKLLGITVLEAAIMGSVLAAVSPAVIVPRMLHLMEHKIGTKKSIPQLIMAGASVDDVFVIVLFTSFIGLSEGTSFSVMSLVIIPVSIILGIGVGIVFGLMLTMLFKKIRIRDSLKIILFLGLSFALVSLECVLPISALIGVMSMGATILARYDTLAKRLSGKFTKLWVGAEILLFVLVGASVDVSYAVTAGIGAVILILSALIFRMAGVMLCLVKTKLNLLEKIFCVISYMPKATVQAAIGGIPLSMGLACGNIVLTVSLVAILITAPIGAFLIDMFHKKLLQSE
ncbi:MAG: cation:proton antiporter [Oscillospiraceae bacterium]